MIVRIFKRKRDIAAWIHDHFRPITWNQAELVADAVAVQCAGGWMIDASVSGLEATVWVAQGLPISGVAQADRAAGVVRLDTLPSAGVEVDLLPGL